MVTRVLIAERDRTLRNAMREMVTEDEDNEVVGMARDGQEAVQMAMQLSPDVALIAYNLPGMSGPQTSEILNSLSPDIMTGLIADQVTPEHVTNALRSGARAVVARPVKAEQISSLIGELAGVRSRRRSSEILQWVDPTQYPQIITVTGAKGGVGKSTVAVNLSAILARDAVGKVVLVDFYTQFGDISTMFNFTPKGTIAEIMPVCAELDVELVNRYIYRHPSGVHILVMSVQPLPPDVVDIECLDNLFYVLKRTYRYIIVDMPPIMHETTLNVLIQSNRVLLVANLLDLTTLTDTKKYYDALRAERIASHNLGIVLNRMSKANKLQLRDIGDMFDSKVLAEIPNYERIITAINQGTPSVLMDKDSVFTRGIEQLASTVSAPPYGGEATNDTVPDERILVAR